jgi:hypothetical protein
MFEHLKQREKRRFRIDRTALLAALVVMVVVVLGVTYGVVFLLDALGLGLNRAPVEVTYDPFQDGTQLEELLGPDEVPPELEVIDTGWFLEDFMTEPAVPEQGDL